MFGLKHTLSFLVYTHPSCSSHAVPKGINFVCLILHLKWMLAVLFSQQWLLILLNFLRREIRNGQSSGPASSVRKKNSQRGIGIERPGVCHSSKIGRHFLDPKIYSSGYHILEIFFSYWKVGSYVCITSFEFACHSQIFVHMYAIAHAHAHAHKRTCNSPYAFLMPFDGYDSTLWADIGSL